MKISVTDLPFNSFLGIEKGNDITLLRLPSGKQYLNHLGTVHAAAQLALAEASSGEFLLRHFDSTDHIIPVVRHLEAKFRKPPMAALRPLRVRRLSRSQSLTRSSLQKAVPSFRLPWSSTTSTVRILSLQRSSGLFSATKRSDEISNGRTDCRLYRSLRAVKVLLAPLCSTLTVLAPRGERSLSVHAGDDCPLNN